MARQAIDGSDRTPPIPERLPSFDDILMGNIDTERENFKEKRDQAREALTRIANAREISESFGDISEKLPDSPTTFPDVPDIKGYPPISELPDDEEVSGSEDNDELEEILEEIHKLPWF